MPWEVFFTAFADLPSITLPLYHPSYLFIPNPIVLILQINDKSKELPDLLLSVTKEHLKRNGIGIGKQLSLLRHLIPSLAAAAVRCLRDVLQLSS